ncbi:hypothetical protein [Streptomyces sp. CB03238]|nr:hypothetical protein [Streptomyces sp. CB03238]
MNSPLSARDSAMPRYLVEHYFSHGIAGLLTDEAIRKRPARWALLWRRSI